MLQNQHFGLASILAGILALSNLLTLTETRAQQLTSTGEQPNPTRRHETSTQINAPLERPSDTKEAAGSTTDLATESNGIEALGGTAHEANSPRALALPPVLEMPALAKLTPLDKAYLDAFSILREPNQCSNFFGGPRALEALNELKLQLKTVYLDRSIGLRMQGKTTYTINQLSGLSYRLFEKAELNINGPFFKNTINFPLDSRVPRIGEYAPNTREARVTILLHELGHLIRTPDKNFLLPNDGDNPGTSKQNTLRVIEVCREQIKRQSQISFERTLAGARSDSGTNAELAAIAQPARPSWSNITRNGP